MTLDQYLLAAADAAADTRRTTAAQMPTPQPHATMGGGGCAAAAPNHWRNQLGTDTVPTPYQRRVQRAHTQSRHTGETIKTRLQ